MDINAHELECARAAIAARIKQSSTSKEAREWRAYLREIESGPMTISTIYLHDAQSHTFLGSCGYYESGAMWGWLAGIVAEEYGCTPDDVSSAETDDGDRITAAGRVVAYTRRTAL